MKKYYTHSFTDDRGRKIFESKDGERLINTDSKYCKVSKNTIATVRDNGEPLRKLN